MAVPELIRNEVDGLLVEPRDEHGLAGALERLLTDPELRLRLGKSARRRVAGSYNLHRNAAELAAMLVGIHARGLAPEIGPNQGEC
jgi:glycosyltransferase involved in cell wall biosynthesis